jgi:hypothetical protein
VADYNLVQCVFDREDLSPDEDVAIVTMHIRQVVEASPDILPVTDQGRDDFTQDVRDWWEQIRQYVSVHVVLQELRFYNVPDQPGADMGDPVRVTPLVLQGTSSVGVMPPQCAVSVTWKTAQRKRWGRIYIPGCTLAILTSEGRIQGAVQNTMANAAVQLTDRSGTGAALIVFSRVHWTHSDVEQVQVDDVVDIIRRRRFSSVNYRALVDASP